ncbi:MAG: hypothetical protein ABIF10_07500 [Candidatus Woesearchaeota archaeon]
MRRILLPIIITLLCASLCLGAKSISGDRVVINKPVEDNLAAAGSQISVSAKIQGDLLCAGGRVYVDNFVEDDIICAAGDINIGEEVGGDVRVVGGNVVISAKIKGDLIVAGGSVLVKDSAIIGKDVSIIGGQVEFLGSAARNVEIKGGNVVFGGAAGKNVFLEAGNIRFLDGAAIRGNLTYTSSADVDLSPADIGGGVYRKVPPVKPTQQIFRAYILAKGFAYLALLLIGIIILSLLPGYVNRTGGNFGKNFWRSLGWGALIVFAAPIAMLVLLVTVIGIPLAVIALLSYIVLIYLSKLASCYWITSKYKGLGTRIAVLVLVLLLIYVIVSIPFIGWLIHLVIIVAGAGAMLTALPFRRQEEKRSRR